MSIGQRASGARLFVAALLWLASSVVAPPGQEPAAAAERSRRILILYSNRVELPANAILGGAIRSAINAGTEGPIEFYSEHLDVSRFPGETHLRLQGDFPRQRYADKTSGRGSPSATRSARTSRPSPATRSSSSRCC